MYLPVPRTVGTGDFSTCYPTEKKRGLSPNASQKVVTRTIAAQVHLTFSSNLGVTQSSFNLLLIQFIFIQFFLQFLIRWQ